MKLWMTAILGLLICLPAVADQTITLGEFPVQPDTFQQLTFEAQTPPQTQARWVIRMHSEQGESLYDGALDGDWQTLAPDTSTYTHAFLVPRGAHTLTVNLRYEGARPTVGKIDLKPVTPPHHILNGDFTLGSDNYTGWTEGFNSQLIQKDGKPAMFVDVAGYALSEYFPVTPGQGYRYVRGVKTWPGVQLLGYDANRRFHSLIPHDARKKPSITIPAGVVYARVLLHTSHDHLEGHRTTTHPRLALERLDDVSADDVTSASAAQPASKTPDGEIILQPGCDPREEYAARELQHWIAQITGRTWPILADPSPIDRLKIHVGQSWASRHPDDVTFLAGTQGYAVRRQGNVIDVFGVTARGTMYGVYALLERNTDLIWARPSVAIGAVYSQRDRIAFDDADFRSKPAFLSRMISNAYRSEPHVFQDWMTHNGLNTPQHIHKGFDYLSWVRGSTVGYGGSYLHWIGAKGEKEPDFYPLVDGARSISIWRQPCYTHPDVPRRIADHIRKRFTSKPGDRVQIDYLHVTLADNWTVCACERCLEPITLKDGSLLAPKATTSTGDPLFFSTRNFIMLNKVAELLSDDYPNLRIATHAYIFTAEPPKVDIHPMILPEFAAYPTQNLRYPIMAGQGQVISTYTKNLWKRRFSQWRDQHPNGLGYFGYYYPSGFNAVADSAAADYRDLLAFGGIQAHTEGYGVDSEELSPWDYDGMEKWVIARLMWDPNQDVDALRQTYTTRVYHEAAPVMTQFHKLIHRVWNEAPESVFVNCHTSPNDIFETFINKPGIAQEARDLLAKAHETARHPTSREYLRRTLAQFDAMQASYGITTIPQVEEATHEWHEADTPHWEKAVAFSGFQDVDDWRQFKKADAAKPTTVAFMRDRTHLYIRFIAQGEHPSTPPVAMQEAVHTFPQGDRVEMTLRIGNKRNWFITAGPDGEVFSQPALRKAARVATARQDQGWVVMIALPLEAIEWSDASPEILARFGRVYQDTDGSLRESSLGGQSLFNLHGSLWTKMTITPAK